MPTLGEINGMDRAAFTAVLGGLFEHSPWVAEETWDRRLGLRSLGEAGPFREAAQLQADLCATMRGASRERQLALIRAHPDLAGRLALAGKLTAESTREQASAGLTGMGADEFGAFQKLNDAYRARFGFPFIICARLNARAAILSAMQARISNNARTGARRRARRDRKNRRAPAAGCPEDLRHQETHQIHERGKSLPISCVSCISW